MSESIELFLCGDVMVGRGVDQIQRHHAASRIHEPHLASATAYVELAERRSGPVPRDVEPSYVWGDALAEIQLRRADARIVNLETALTTSDAHWPGKGIHYRSHPANAALLRAAQVDACALANNHVLDWGYPGLAETVAALDDAGIAHAGAGSNAAEAWRPAIVETGRGRVVLAAFGSTNSGIPAEWAATDSRPGVGLSEGWSLAGAESVAAALETVRRPGDIVVVSVHWGSNWGHDRPRAQRQLAHALLDRAGADVVHGHSSHHPRRIEIHAGKLILYGCGDFITDYEGIGRYERGFYRGDLAVAYFARLERETGRLEMLSMVPYRSHRLRLRRAGAEDGAALAAMFDQLGRAAGVRISLAADGTVSATASPS